MAAEIVGVLNNKMLYQCFDVNSCQSPFVVRHVPFPRECTELGSVVSGQFSIAYTYGTTPHSLLWLLTVLSDSTRPFNLSLTMSPESLVN